MSTFFHSSMDHREIKLNVAARETDAADAERPVRSRVPIYSRLYNRIGHTAVAQRKRSRRFSF